MDLKTKNLQHKFWSLSSIEAANFLKTDLERGLSASEAEERLTAFGRNAFRIAPKNTRIGIFLNQLKSPLILILVFAGIITVAISHLQDALFIFIAVFVNSALGFYQENKAEQALSEIKTYLRQRARVIRDGREREVDAEELVIGDIIRLAQGDRVPADARISFVNDFQADESVLTGESLPVTKSADPSAAEAEIPDQDSMVFAGTLVIQGVCAAIVCRTNADTELGKIASLIASSEDEKTPLQKAVIRFSLYLSIILATLTLVVFGIGIAVGYPVVDMFLTAVAVAVSSIPEGLPISTTVILAVGVERMAKRKGVVRRLIAAEALGGTTVILTDKTGTLTMAKMLMSKIVSFGIGEEKLLARALANANVLVENPEDDPELWRMSGKTMEMALVRSAGLRGISIDKIISKEHVLQSLPFNAIHKFSASLIRESGKHLIVFFGAPDILAAHSYLNESERKEILSRIEALAFSGERVLGVASKEISNTEDFSFTDDVFLSDLSLDGLVTFRDPVRPGIKQAIEKVRAAGIRTIILTGDHRGTAVAVAKEIGLDIDGESVLDASEFSKLSENELKERIPRLSVISRVTPLDKMRIAKVLQGMGEVVAMTGDGVNDAPSIKRADVGIAMGSGTEVAQSVADLVLLDDNFETIVAAIEEGRQILSNIRKVLIYLLSSVTNELVLVGGSLLMGMALPFNALQILWVNFFTDSFPAVAYAFERDPDNLSRHLRRSKSTKLFDPLSKFLIFSLGIFSSAFLFILYYWLMRSGCDEAIIRTFIFASFGTYTLLIAFSVRSLDKSIWSYPLFSNRYLNGGVIAGLVLMALSIYHPALQAIFKTVSLPLNWVIGVFLIGLFNVALVELVKLLFKYKKKMFK